MEHNNLAMALPYLCKYFIFFDMNKNQYNDHLFLSRWLVNVYFLHSTLSCLGDTETTHQSASKLHDSVYLLTLILNEICFYTNKTRLYKILQYIMEEVEDYEQETQHAKIIENYHKEKAFYSKVVVFGCVGGTLLYYLVAAMYFYFLVKEGEKCIHLPMGWTWYSESYLYFIILNAVAAHSILASSFIWFLVMYCIVLKMKSEIRLLCADMAPLDEIINVPEILLAGNSSSLIRSLEDDLSMRVQPADDVSNSDVDEESTLFESTKVATVQEFKDYIRERIVEFRVKAFLRKLVDRHVRIIEYVKVTDKTFRSSIAYSIQLGMVIVALFLGKFNWDEPLELESVLQIIELPEVLGCLGLFNYVGQIMLDESEYLHQTLYNCSWADKPLSLKRGLLIMLTVATRPLRLTMGGVSTLSLETYAKELQATYSYISIVRSINNKLHGATTQ